MQRPARFVAAGFAAQKAMIMERIIQPGSEKRLFIISHSTKVKKNGEQPVWTDEKNNMAVHTGDVYEIHFMQPIPGAKDTYIKVELTAQEIKNLHAEVTRIEAIETDEFVD